MDAFELLVDAHRPAMRSVLARLVEVFRVHGGVTQSRFPRLDEGSFRERKPTSFAFYEKRFGVSVARARELVIACSADETLARRLRVRKGTALLEIRRTAYDARGAPVEFRRRFLNSRRFAYAGR